MMVSIVSTAYSVNDGEGSNENEWSCSVVGDWLIVDGIG